MIYAHTKETDKQNWQTLAEHMQNVSGLMQMMLLPIPENVFTADDKEWISDLLAVLHDVGKATIQFQNYLIISVNEPDKYHKSPTHSAVGAAFLFRYTPYGRILAYIIACHHTGLCNYIHVVGDFNEHQTLMHRIESKIYEILPNDTHKENDTLKAIEPFTKNLNCNYPIPNIFSDKNKRALCIRMLFSCLIDADWLDTEHFYDPNKRNIVSFPTITELSSIFNDYMSKKLKDASKTTINQLRAEVLDECIKAGNTTNTGIYDLTTPTGAGKTLSSMAFALSHAITNNKSRIIYVIPVTTIIEQTANQFKSIFGSDNVIVHYSGVDFSDIEDIETIKKLCLATENWDAPIILTTDVQFFESFYAAKPSKCRKLHNIINSVVIFDEIQSLNLNCLYPCTNIINQLTEDYGVTSILCTATQPVFNALPDSKYRINSTPIISSQLSAKLNNALTRVTYSYDLSVYSNQKKRTYEEIASKLLQHNEVLCVVNTRRDCYNLYYEVRKQADPDTTVISLSALQCGEHRSELIAQIKQQLTLNKTNNEIKKLIVISTPVIEVGVDIDFPVVYRELAGLPSIIQTAGRANREGTLGIKGGKVVLFELANTRLPEYIRIGQHITRSLINENRDPNNPNDLNAAFLNDPDELNHALKSFFSRYYNFTDELGLNIIKLLIDDGESGIAFETVSKKFKLINDDYYVSIFVRYKEGNELIETLLKNDPDKQLLRKLQRYMVNVPKSNLNKLLNTKIQEYRPGIYVQMPGFYDQNVGFDFFTETTMNC